ncbi:MAG: PAS domain-containing sensor histidine kinase [Bryobacteraceae bacterium]|nr:MAG: PAS domain-containing sensor histidine kinase [Bryobacteraceae bacterium]
MPARPRTVRSPLFRKILIAAALLVLVMSGISDILLSRYTQESEESAVRRSLEASARVLARELAATAPDRLAAWVHQTDDLLGVRVTVVAHDGSVLAESRRQPESMENHARRPEIQAALRAGLGVAKRHSSSVNMDFLYLALPARLGTGQPAILRVAAPLETIESAVRANRWRILRATLLVAFAVLVGAYLFTRSLTRRIHRIQQAAEDLAEGRFTGNPPPLLDTGRDELGALAASLHRMAGNLLEMVELVRAESARREAILSSMREGVLAVDSSLRITFCNEAFLQAVAVKQPPEEGTPLEQVSPDPALLEPLWQVLEHGETVRGKISFPSTPGRSYELYAKPLELNRQKGALAILHDVTEIERLERVRRDFVANVSHELRTPLTAIRGYAETLLDGAIDDAEHNRRFLEVIRSNAIRLTNIASDLLVLSELEQHRTTQEPTEHVPLQPVIESVIRTVESAARIRQIAIQAEPTDLAVRGLRFRLEQALVNLVDNAVKFSPPGSTVRIECNRTGEGLVEIHVIDNGIGIPEADLPRIFERFYRVDKARSRDAGGTGLGLSIVKHIAELYGGSVRVKSRLGEGSTFTLSFPEA